MKLEIILGCMFSGKSTALLRKLTKFSEVGLKVLYINHALDTRTNTSFSTHSKLIQTTKLCFDSIKVDSFKEGLSNIVDDYDVIGIDEAQFFGEEIVSFVIHLVETLKKDVLVASLDSTFERKIFGHVHKLMPYADSIIKLHAYCTYCFDTDKHLEMAIFSHRVSEDTEEVVVGSSIYKPVCRKCYLRLND